MQNSTPGSRYPLLDEISSPADMRELSPGELGDRAAEGRRVAVVLRRSCVGPGRSGGVRSSLRLRRGRAPRGCLSRRRAGALIHRT